MNPISKLEPNQPTEPAPRSSQPWTSITIESGVPPVQFVPRPPLGYRLLWPGEQVPDTGMEFYHGSRSWRPTEAPGTRVPDPTTLGALHFVRYRPVCGPAVTVDYGQRLKTADILVRATRTQAQVTWKSSLNNWLVSSAHLNTVLEHNLSLALVVHRFLKAKP